jgi:hypothetical protein
LKTIAKIARDDIGDDSVWDQITKFLEDYEQVSASFTVRGAFRKAGFTADVRSNPVRLVFNEEILCENPGFSEIWNANISVDQFSKRLWSHQSGILNADFLTRRPDE